jgi:hypothetical protein
MADYYTDSSVLVKRHIQEIGASWFQALADPPAANVIITARISLLEVYSAFNRWLREAYLDTPTMRGSRPISPPSVQQSTKSSS